ncbi:MAG: glycosyltransferase [Candidatus Omnitrophota bacterium]
MFDNLDWEKREKTDVSVVIIARNCEDYLLKSLPIIPNQKTSFSCEIIGICTKSQDRTLEVFNRYCTKTIEISSKEFHHAKTRNLGVRTSKGEFIVFLTGDAIPANEHWLQNLVAPLIKDEEIAAAYSKQIPYPDTPPWEKRDILGGVNAGLSYKKRKVDFSNLEQVKDYKNNIGRYIMFSNVSAVYRGALIRKHPFNESIPAVEDQEWCKRIIELGYATLFVPNSVVIHSHNHSLNQVYFCHYRYGKAFAKFLNCSTMLDSQNIWKIFKMWTYEITEDLRFVWGGNTSCIKKIFWAFASPFYRIVKILAYREGLTEYRENK